MRVLLIEDDDTIAEPLADGLSRYGFTVSRVATGEAGLRATAHDMVLLDLGLPDMDGIDVCRRLREDSQVPIIMLTARGSEADRVVGLELGADDYLSKPFSLRELVARMRAVGRRVPAVGQAIGALCIDRRARSVTVHGRPAPLSPKEFDLLALLADDPGAVVPRQRLLDAVWGSCAFGAGRTLDFHVASLRRKLGDPDWIETRRGVGFRIAVPPQPVPVGQEGQATARVAPGLPQASPGR